MVRDQAVDLLLQLPSLPLFPLLRDKDDRSELGRIWQIDAMGKLLLWTRNKLYHTHILSITSTYYCMCIFGFIVLISSQLLSCISPTSYFAYGCSMHMLLNAPQRSHQNFGLADIAISCVYASRAGVGRKWSALVWKRAQFTWVFVLHSQRFGAI